MGHRGQLKIRQIYNVFENILFQVILKLLNTYVQIFWNNLYVDLNNWPVL